MRAFAFAFAFAAHRVFFGPDSPHARFEPDSCSTMLGLPTCAQWLPDHNAFLQLLTQKAPAVLGGWCLMGLVAASMSTSDGAILAMATVFSHNLLRQLSRYLPRALSRERLLLLARVATVPFAVAAGAIASYRANIAATLLIVAFDVVLATVVAPLFGCFYARKPSARAALLSLLTGGALRLSLQFALPKDGSFLPPYATPEFLNFGAAPSLKLPLFVDARAHDVWNPQREPCVQQRFRDYSGLDSLAAFAASVVVFVAVQLIESRTGALFRFPGDVPYDNNGAACGEHDAPNLKYLHAAPAAAAESTQDLVRDDQLA